MKRNYRFHAATALALALFVGVPAASQAHTAHQQNPTLRFVAKAGYRISLAGKGWAPTARVTVTARAGGLRSVQLMATSQGRFIVGITNIDLCGGSSYAAHDLAGHVATLRGPALMCPNRLPEPDPTLTVLKGRTLHPHAVSLVVNAPQGPLTMHVGQLLNAYVSSPMNSSTPETVHLDGKHWLQTASTTGFICPPGAMCAPQVRPFLQWEAVHAGKAIIRITPACRQTVPQCALPDVIVDVFIT